MSTNSYVEHYKQKLRESSIEIEKDPIEAPVADYKKAFDELYEVNQKLREEIDQLKVTIKEENSRFNKEQSKLMDESHKIVSDHNIKKDELKTKYQTINSKINELDEWFQNQAEITNELEEAQKQEQQIDKEKEIILKILDDFIKITKSIAEGNVDTSYLTSNFTSAAKRVNVPGFYANVEALKQALVKKVFSQNVYEFQ